MQTFRSLITVALTAGMLSGLVWFGLQFYTILPLIETAERYEAAASHDHEDHVSGLSRNLLTAVTTVLTAIGFAAALFGTVSLTGRQLDVRSGALWGLCAFACVGLAPALGLPPQPPGTAVADLASRQLWWLGTVFATGLGLYWIISPARRLLRTSAGVVCLLLPHVIGAPPAVGQNEVPDSLVRQFELASLAASGVFWLTLGTVGGLIWKPRA